MPYRRAALAALGLAAFAALFALVHVVSSPSDGAESPVSPTPLPAATSIGEGETTPHARSSDSREPRRESTLEIREESEPAAIDRVPLFLELVEHGNRRPLADFRLALRQGETELELATDGFGRARTEPVWTSEPLRVRHVADPSRAEYRAEWRLDPFELTPPSDGDRAIVVEAEAPALVIEVDVQRAGGSPAPGAWVELVYGWRDAARGFHSEFVDPTLADATGRARFAVFDAEARASAAYLAARDEARGLASPPLFLDPPLRAGPWRLELEATGSVLLAAFGHAGEPLESGKVIAVSAETIEAATGVAHASIEHGSARIEGLAPARHRLRVFDASSGDRRELEVDVQPSVETRAEVRFDDGRTGLAAAGRVVDEDEQPLERVTIWFSAPGGIEGFDFTDAEGRFRFWSERAASIVVSTSSDAQSDLFEPASIEAPFGARELVLRRVAKLPERSVRFEASDADAGGPPLDGGGVFAWVGAPRSAGGWLWQPLEAGAAVLEPKVREGLRYSVRCPGYVEARGALEPPADPNAPWVVRVALRRGFARELLVVDRRSGAPVPAAQVTAVDGELSARSGSDGVVRLASEAWPARLRVERAGYLERVVDPNDLELVTDRVELEPIGERR